MGHVFFGDFGFVLFLCRPSVILGVTNPFFAKTLQHWPHIIRIGDLKPAGKVLGVLVLVCSVDEQVCFFLFVFIAWLLFSYVGGKLL